MAHSHPGLSFMGERTTGLVPLIIGDRCTSGFCPLWNSSSYISCLTSELARTTSELPHPSQMAIPFFGRPRLQLSFVRRITATGNSEVFPTKSRFPITIPRWVQLGRSPIIRIVPARNMTCGEVMDHRTPTTIILRDLSLGEVGTLYAELPTFPTELQTQFSWGRSGWIAQIT